MDKCALVVVLTLSLFVSMGNCHYVLDCVSTSPKIYERYYKSNASSSSSNRTLCIPGTSLESYINIVFAEDFGKNPSLCAENDRFRTPIEVYPGQPLYYTYSSVLDYGDLSLTSESKYLVLEVKTNLTLPAENSKVDYLPTYGSIYGRFSNPACQNGDLVCSTAMVVPKTMRLGLTTVMWAWYTMGPDPGSLGSEVKIPTSPRKKGYFTSCLTFNVLDKYNATTLRPNTSDT